jgi:hypothetical protein
MGIMVVEESGTVNPATEAPVVEAAATEEEVEIEEIICPEEEKVAPQCVRVVRKQDDECGCSMKKTTWTGLSANCSRQWTTWWAK